MIAQAYCAALEDSIQGDYQKASDIKEKMQVNYMELCIKYTKINHASLTQSSVNNRRTNKQLKTAPVALYKPGDNRFVLCTAKSIWKHFKTKIGHDCMAMNGVAASNPRLSGENEDQYWERCSIRASSANRQSWPIMICMTATKNPVRLHGQWQCHFREVATAKTGLQW
jgi:hypothetical protein